MLDEIDDATVVVVANAPNALLTFNNVIFWINLQDTALINQFECQTPVEKGHLLEASRQGHEVVLSRLEDVGVGPECDGGSGFCRCLTLFQRCSRRAA